LVWRWVAMLTESVLNSILLIMIALKPGYGTVPLLKRARPHREIGTHSLIYMQILHSTLDHDGILVHSTLHNYAM
jgi:hypothetical protein